MKMRRPYPGGDCRLLIVLVYVVAACGFDVWPHTIDASRGQLMRIRGGAQDGRASPPTGCVVANVNPDAIDCAMPQAVLPGQLREM